MSQHQNPLMEMATALQGKTEAELELLGLTTEEIEMIEVYTDPVKWAATHIDWIARDYQYEILQTIVSAKQTVLRLGRRLGKTECMCIAIWWHAMLQPNKGDNNQYDILIITPYETQIDLIFKRLKEMLAVSPQLKASVKREVYHLFQLHNGTNIRGLTAGTKSSSGAASTRGQRADVIILDEVDYMGEEDITNIQNIRNEAPERIKIIAASTPSGRRASFYKWCVGAPTNGWREVYAPSTVNPELMKWNPDTNRTYLEDLKEELTDMRYIQEVMAEFGEEQAGVYLKKHIDAAVELGRQLNITYADGPIERKGPRILGVDWDKYGASTNMVGVEYNQQHQIYSPFVRSEIPRGMFTYDNAIKRIIELNELYDFDYIYVDAGHGESQIEQLHLYGIKHPETGLDKKVVRVNFSSKVTVIDPVTKTTDKKDIKPFMVNNSVFTFERLKFAFNPTDKEMIKQFEDYHVTRFGTNGRPVYTDENEHIHDCITLALLGFYQKYDQTFKIKHASFIGQLDVYSKTSDKAFGRDMEKKEENRPTFENGQSYVMMGGINYINGGGSRGGRQNGHNSRITGGRGMPSRKSF